MEESVEGVAGHSIAAVERDTGLQKDTLRVWERRYGFPQPLRDANGERVYPPEQLARLRQIKRLIDQGMRPGKVVAADPASLEDWLGSAPVAASAPQHAEFLALLRRQHSGDLRQHLQQNLLKLGLQRFVTELVGPLGVEVGLAWQRGEISVAEEHLYTEQLQTVLRSAIQALHNPAQRPRVLLTTFPDEQHSLGLLMAEAMLAPEGACCTSLGIQTPLADIVQAATAGDFDIVALAFSSHFPARQAYAGLAQLRQQLPTQVEVWVGSKHLAERAATDGGLIYLAGMADVLDALQRWRNLNA
jgi:DNA-binding transcriptional MerR regulator